MRTGAYLLVVKREDREATPSLEVWKRRAVPPREYRLVATHTVALGKVGHATPRGVYYVISRSRNPDWHVPDEDWAGELRGQVIKGDDPRNPIQVAFLQLTDDPTGNIGIHGTNDLSSLGKRASHGCIRVHPDVALDLFYRVRKGTPVVIF